MILWASFYSRLRLLWPFSAMLGQRGAIDTIAPIGGWHGLDQVGRA